MEKNPTPHILPQLFVVQPSSATSCLETLNTFLLLRLCIFFSVYIVTLQVYAVCDYRSFYCQYKFNSFSVYMIYYTLYKAIIAMWTWFLLTLNFKNSYNILNNTLSSSKAHLSSVHTKILWYLTIVNTCQYQSRGSMILWIQKFFTTWMDGLIKVEPGNKHFVLECWRRSFQAASPVVVRTSDQAEMRMACAGSVFNPACCFALFRNGTRVSWNFTNPRWNYYDSFN